MKNIVRAFVIALTLTGVAASAHTATAKTTVQVSNPMLASYPVPVCPPDDPNACGLGQPK